MDSFHGWPFTQPGSLHTALQRKYTQPCPLFSRGTAVWTMGARLCEQWGPAVCKCPAVQRVTRVFWRNCNHISIIHNRETIMNVEFRCIKQQQIVPSSICCNNLGTPYLFVYLFIHLFIYLFIYFPIEIFPIPHEILPIPNYRYYRYLSHWILRQNFRLERWNSTSAACRHCGSTVSRTPLARGSISPHWPSHEATDRWECGERRAVRSMQQHQASGAWFNINMSSYRYMKSHCWDKTVVRSSYLHNGVSFTGKMSSSYWIRALDR